MIDLMGHLHPFLVHFPIGILVIACVMIWLRAFRKTDFQSSISLLSMLGALTAGAACISGYLLSQSGDYQSSSVNPHQWWGIGTCLLAIALYFFHAYRTIISVLVFLALAITGHLGGELTYGANYLFQQKKSVISSKEIQRTLDSSLVALAKDTTVQVLNPTKKFPFQDEVLPILKNHCFQCHSSKKQKGKLRLDSELFIKKGGKEGAILLAGNPLKSHLYKYLILPEDDDLHMPPEGKKQLNSRQIAIIRRWIEIGAPFGEYTGALPSSAMDISSSENSPMDEVNSPANEAMVKPMKSLEPVNPEFILEAKNLGLSVSSVASHPAGLSVNFVNVKQLDAQVWQAAKKIQDHIFQIKLGKRKDVAVEELLNFPQLEQLNLEQSNIQDKDLEILGRLPNLKRLNLYGTSVSDAGVKTLASMKALKVLYIWQSKLSQKGLQSLQSARPDLQVVQGEIHFTPPDTNRLKAIK